MRKTKVCVLLLAGFTYCWSTCLAESPARVTGSANRGDDFVEKGLEKHYVLQFRTLEAERVDTVMEGGGFMPTAVLLQNGELVVMSRGSEGGYLNRGGVPNDVTRGGNLQLVRSRDGGRTWSEPVWVIGARQDQDIRDAWMTQLKNGSLIFGFHIFHFGQDGLIDWDNTPVYVTRSKDNGYTWEIPTPVDISPFTFGFPMGQVIELPSGTLLMSVVTSYTHFPPYGNIWRPVQERGFQSYVFRSRDGGKTWGDRSLVGKHGDDEIHLLRLPSGKLLAATRSSRAEGFTGGVYISESRDEGRTWRDLGPVSEPLVDSPGHLLLLKDGRILLTYGDRAAPFYGVEAMLSRDEGETWDRENRLQLVWDAPTTDCGYPISIELPDGRIFTVYYQVDDPANPARAKAKAVIWKLPK